MLTTTWLKCLEAIMAIWLQMIFWHSFFSDKPFPVRQVPCIEESVLKTCVLFPAWGMRKIIGAASNWSKDSNVDICLKSSTNTEAWLQPDQ